MTILHGQQEFNEKLRKHFTVIYGQRDFTTIIHTHKRGACANTSAMPDYAFLSPVNLAEVRKYSGQHPKQMFKAPAADKPEVSLLLPGSAFHQSPQRRLQTQRQQPHKAANHKPRVAGNDPNPKHQTRRFQLYGLVIERARVWAGARSSPIFNIQT